MLRSKLFSLFGIMLIQSEQYPVIGVVGCTADDVGCKISVAVCISDAVGRKTFLVSFFFNNFWYLK